VVQNQALLLTPQVDQIIQPRPRERRNQFPQHRLQVDHREDQPRLVVGAKPLIKQARALLQVLERIKKMRNTKRQKLLHLVVPLSLDSEWLTNRPPLWQLLAVALLTQQQAEPNLLARLLSDPSMHNHPNPVAVMTTNTGKNSFSSFLVPLFMTAHSNFFSLGPPQDGKELPKAIKKIRPTKPDLRIS